MFKNSENARAISVVSFHNKNDVLVLTLLKLSPIV